MNTCKTCVHWKTEFATTPRIFRHNGIIPGGECNSPMITEDYGKDCYTEKSLVYSYDEGGSFWTGPDFGCVNHEHKTES